MPKSLRKPLPHNRDINDGMKTQISCRIFSFNELAQQGNICAHGGLDTTTKGKSTHRTRREQKEPPQANKQRKEQREAQRKKIEYERNKRHKDKHPEV